MYREESIRGAYRGRVKALSSPVSTAVATADLAYAAAP